jgi:DNA-binding FrmR family transcriptional regulator
MRSNLAKGDAERDPRKCKQSCNRRVYQRGVKKIRYSDHPRCTIPYQVWYYLDLNMSHTINDKQKLVLRAKRIQGQVEALVRALTEERDCSEVLQVMSAARGAMNSLMAELLEGHIRSHVLSGKQRPTSQQVVAADEVIDMVKSYLK